MKQKRVKAIETLKKYLKELDDVKDTQSGNDWKAKTIDSFIIFLGSDSALTQRLEKTYFTDLITEYHDRDIGITAVHLFNEQNKEKFRNMVKHAIEHIKENGLKEDVLSSNFLNQFSSKELIGGIITASTIVFAIGSYLGTFSKEREIIATEKKMEVLQRKYNDLMIKYDSMLVKPKVNYKSNTTPNGR